MRRISDRPPSTLFRGAELARLMTMLIMLGVIAMLMGRARDPRTWRMFVGDEESNSRGQFTLAQVDAEAEKERESEETSAELGARSAEQTEAEQASAEIGARTAEQQNAEPEAEKTVIAPAAEKSAEVILEAAQPAAEQPAAERPAENEVKAPAENPDQPQFKPTDEDPDEKDSLQEELEAITDKAPLTKEEMFAYRRMLKWSMNATTAQLRKRAKTNVRFGELFQNPDKFRGKLLDLDVHIRQAVVDNDLPKNDLGLKRTFEVWGWNNSSQPYSYVLVCAEVPRDMPLGPGLGEEGRFVGYFLKLMSYEDHEGKRRSAPLLIGRLVWDPSPEALAKVNAAGKIDWRWWLLAGVLLVLFALRWGTRMLAAPRPMRSSLPRARRNDSEEEVVPLDTWLDRAEATNQPGDAIKHHATGEEDTQRG